MHLPKIQRRNYNCVIFWITTHNLWNGTKQLLCVLKSVLFHRLHSGNFRGEKKNLFFAEPPPWVADSKNIWVAQFHHAYRAYCEYIIPPYPPLYYICQLLTQNARYASWNWATHIFLESSTKGSGSPKTQILISCKICPEWGKIL